MQIVHTIAELDGANPCVYVPTMGALHRGHRSLIKQASQLAHHRNLPGGCVVSIFVNPTQFDEETDYTRYPRDLHHDAMICSDCGATTVWAPERDEIYPEGVDTYTGFVPDQARDKGLEDAARPGHLVGVCQVVSRLFECAKPRVAVFGEKDWQQLQVITALANHMNELHGWSLEIVPGKTVREGDGLAMSSRNVFLSQLDRVRAAGLRRSLLASNRASDPEQAETLLRTSMEAAGIEVEYAAIRDAHTLKPISSTDPSQSCRALAAGRLGTTRILDNCAWGEKGSK